MAKFVESIEDITRMPPAYERKIEAIDLITDNDKLIQFMKQYYDIQLANNGNAIVKLGFTNNIIPENGLFGNNAYIFSESLDVINDKSPSKGKVEIRRALLCAVVMCDLLHFGIKNQPVLPDGFPIINKNAGARTFNKCGYEFSVYSIEQVIPLYNIHYTIGNIQTEIEAPKLIPKIDNIIFILPELARYLNNFKEMTQSPEIIKSINSLIKKLIIDCSIDAKNFLDDLTALLHTKLNDQSMVDKLDILVKANIHSNNSRNNSTGGYKFPNYKIQIDDFKDDIAALPLKKFIKNMSELIIINSIDSPINAELIRI